GLSELLLRPVHPSLRLVTERRTTPGGLMRSMKCWLAFVLALGALSACSPKPSRVPIALATVDEDEAAHPLFQRPTAPLRPPDESGPVASAIHRRAKAYGPGVNVTVGEDGRVSWALRYATSDGGGVTVADQGGPFRFSPVVAPQPTSQDPLPGLG